MKNYFKLYKERRARKKQLKRLAQFSRIFGMMEKLEKSGYFHWDSRHSRLCISETFADVMMSRGAEPWASFLNNLYLYASYNCASEQWHQKLVAKQGKAIAEAKKLRPMLSADEIQSIRSAVAAELTETDVKPQPVKQMQFFVISDSADMKGAALLCGTYNPATDTLDVVPWRQVQSFIGDKPK